jgi:hypothetical protein
LNKTPSFSSGIASFFIGGLLNEWPCSATIHGSDILRKCLSNF